MNVPDPTAQVSCQALQVLFDYAQGRGVSLKELQAGLSYGPEYLERGGNWVDYATLVQVERSLAAALPNEDQLFFKVGHSIGETRSLGFLRTISRTLLSPSAVYQRIPGLMRRFLFRFVDVQYERVAWNRFRGHYRFTPECPATDAFLETARGVLTSVPLMVGAPPAHVSVIRHSDLYVEIEITVTKWRGLVGFTHGWLRGVAGWGKRRKEAEIDAVAELEHTNRQLQDKIDALTTAKGELELLRDRLEDRVRERTAELEVSQGQLEDTVARLERADRAKSDFFANVSHELKTPLTLILAPLDEVLHILGERDGSLELTLPLSTAHKSAEALHQLVDELLDFASLEAGRMPLQVEPCDLAALVVDACRSLEPLARAQHRLAHRGRFVAHPGHRRSQVADAGGTQPVGQRDQILRGWRSRHDRGARDRRSVAHLCHRRRAGHRAAAASPNFRAFRARAGCPRTRDHRLRHRARDGPRHRSDARRRGARQQRSRRRLNV